MGFLQRFRRSGKRGSSPARDIIRVDVAGLHIFMDRMNLWDVPHEVSVIIPRVEVRDYKAVRGQSVLVREVIFNSVTVVHAPRHEYPNVGGRSIILEVTPNGVRLNGQPPSLPAAESGLVKNDPGSS